MLADLSNTRRGANPGLWLGFILPTILLQTGSKWLAIELISTSIIWHIFSFSNPTLMLCAFTGYMPLFVHSIFSSTSSWRSVSVIGFTLCGPVSLLRMYPYSFTLGEAILISHLMAVFLSSSSLFLIIFLSVLLLERYHNCFFAHFLFSVLGLPIVALLSNAGFFKLIAREILSFWYCHIHAHLMLLSVWGNLLIFCFSLVYLYSRSAYECTPVSASGDESVGEKEELKELPNSNPITDNGKLSGPSFSTSNTMQFEPWPFGLRKLFHFAAGLVFCSGLIWAPQLLSTCAKLLLLFFYAFEFLRRFGPRPIADFLNYLITPFRDERDAGALVFTPIALLLGLSLPLWLPLDRKQEVVSYFGFNCSTWISEPSSWSGILSVAVGDSVAALVGRKWGVRKWTGSHRTLLGSGASLVSQLALWLLLSHYYSWSWIESILPTVAGVFVEAYTTQIDNLIIPLVVMAVFAVQSSLRDIY